MDRLPRPTAGFASRLAPNWFASVMGTGIVANAAILLPRRSGALRDFALAVWIAAAACWRCCSPAARCSGSA